MIEIVLILFMPGFVISYVFFGKKDLTWAQRIGISFVLSIAILPLLVFYTNLFGLAISKETVTYQIIVILSIAGVVNGVKRLLK